MAAQDFRVIPEMGRRDPEWAVLSLIWEELRTPYEPDDRLHTDLTVGQRAVYALTSIWSEVNNGGFDQCFWNSTGFLFPEAVEGADAIHAPRWADLLGRAAALMGTPLPRDRAERQARLEALSPVEQQLLSDLDDEFYALDGSEHGLMFTIETYVSSHHDEFFRPAADEEEAAQALLSIARTILDTDYILRNTPRAEIEALLDGAGERSQTGGSGKAAALATSLREQLPFSTT